jgi:hypothetical protein
MIYLHEFSTKRFGMGCMVMKSSKRQAIFVHSGHPADRLSEVSLP